MPRARPAYEVRARALRATPDGRRRQRVAGAPRRRRHAARRACALCESSAPRLPRRRRRSLGAPTTAARFGRCRRRTTPARHEPVDMRVGWHAFPEHRGRRFETRACLECGVPDLVTRGRSSCPTARRSVHGVEPRDATARAAASLRRAAPMAHRRPSIDGRRSRSAAARACCATARVRVTTVGEGSASTICRDVRPPANGGRRELVELATSAMTTASLFSKAPAERRQGGRAIDESGVRRPARGCAQRSCDRASGSVVDSGFARRVEERRRGAGATSSDERECADVRARRSGTERRARRAPADDEPAKRERVRAKSRARAATRPVPTRRRAGLSGTGGARARRRSRSRA